MRFAPLCAAMIFLCPAVLYAQSCSMCYQNAAASGPHFIEALRSGILILLGAPVIVCTGIAIVVYRKRDVSADD
jgi:hypothetical protein